LPAVAAAEESASKNRKQDGHSGHSMMWGIGMVLDTGFGDPPLGRIAQVALSWIDHDADPRLIVDDQLFILWGNAAARAALARRKDLEARAGVLSTAQAARQSALAEFILDSGAGISCWSMPRGDGDGHLLVRSQRISWEDEGLFGVSFVGSGDDFVPRYASLDSAFGLTRSEHEVLVKLLDGFDPDMIALARGVSLDTVRSQVRQIYAKLEVKTREGLFRRTLPFLL
jgi:DNA-binding CsgD family transcriptional regulator